MQVILARHGMTVGNEHHRYAGVTDHPLSDKGREQAALVEPDRSVRQVYVSPLQRTRQTADYLFPKARQIVIEELHEMDFGDFEDKSAEEMAGNPAYRAWVDGWCLGPCPNGEDTIGFRHRVCGAFERLIRKELAAGAERAVFTIHGGCIMAIMSRYNLPRQDYYSYYIGNCRAYCCEARLEHGQLVLRNSRLLTDSMIPEEGRD